MQKTISRSRGPLMALAATLPIAALYLSGCGCRRETPVTMAPPVTTQTPPVATNYGGGGAGGPVPGNAAEGSVYQWQDVPAGERVPVTRAVFDQGGYQIYARSGETIVVPFANQNLNVMKFGLSDNGGMYFVNDNNQAPILYVPRGGYLENAAAQNARWFPFSQNHHYERPVYVSLAPSWSAFTGMGWYPGMHYYGGYFGYSPFSPFTPMIGLNFLIGGRPYYGWGAYQSYYAANPYNRVYIRNSPSYRYASVGRQSSSSFGRSANRSTSGSFGRTSGRTFGGSGSFGRSSGSSGSFGRTTTGRSSGFGSSGSSGTFGRSTGRTGSFGSSGGSTFGTSSSRPSGSFGSGSSGYSGFGRRSGGSFGSGSSGYSSGGGSFGRSSSGSGGFGRSSSGGSSFGRSSGSSSSGRSSSFGGGRSSFGGGRRR